MRCNCRLLHMWRRLVQQTTHVRHCFLPVVGSPRPAAMHAVTVLEVDSLSASPRIPPCVKSQIRCDDRVIVRVDEPFAQMRKAVEGAKDTIGIEGRQLMLWVWEDRSVWHDKQPTIGTQWRSSTSQTRFPSTPINQRLKRHAQDPIGEEPRRRRAACTAVAGSMVTASTSVAARSVCVSTKAMWVSRPMHANGAALLLSPQLVKR